MGNEEWKAVKDYEGTYEVSSCGRVRRVESYGIRNLKNLYCKGYLHVDLSFQGDAKRCSVHRLVATAFIPNPNNYPQINHKNGIKDDNRVENLEWCTPAMNMNHAKMMNLQKTHGFKAHFGEENGWSILTCEKVKEIKRKYKEGHSTYHSLGHEYGVHFSTIGYIVKGIRWAHIDGGADCTKKKKDYTQLTEQMVKEIRKRYEDKKESFPVLASNYNVHRSTIRKVILRQSWKDI